MIEFISKTNKVPFKKVVITAEYNVMCNKLISGNKYTIKELDSVTYKESNNKIIIINNKYDYEPIENISRPEITLKKDKIIIVFEEVCEFVVSVDLLKFVLFLEFNNFCYEFIFNFESNLDGFVDSIKMKYKTVDQINIVE